MINKPKASLSWGHSLVIPRTTPPTRGRHFIFAVVLFLPLLSAFRVHASPPHSSAPPTIPALFLSDIHLDPFHDPAKVAKLNAAPASAWSALLAAPPSTAQAEDSAALQQTCPVRGVDTTNVLWQSSLAAIRANAAHAKFAVISGDLLAHAFDCKYRTLLPAATHADYIDFVEKTLRYEISSLRANLPGVPIYIAMGNNDTGCGDYKLDPTHDTFLALTANIVAEALPEHLSAADRESVLRDFSAGGYYSVPLPSPMDRTRILVLDDLFLSGKYATCAGDPDPASGLSQLTWLKAQLNAARQRKEHVWVVGHIPPGVDLYGTARKLTNICGAGKPQMFLGSEKVANILAANADIVRLALFGHTHSDEMRLLMPEINPTQDASSPPGLAPGVPLKIVASITPVNGNRPTFTLASIDPATATLVDYTVLVASNLTGIATTWSPEYTYSAAYHQPAFDSAALSSLIAGFQADATAASPASRAYLRNYYPGDVSSIIQFAWPQYACAMDHDSAASFAQCACAAMRTP